MLNIKSALVGISVVGTLRSNCNYESQPEIRRLNHYGH